MAAPMEGVNLSQLSQTPVSCGRRVLPGHILCNEKWRGTDLLSVLQSVVNPIFEDGLGVVDFYASGDITVVYLSEADIVGGMSTSRRKVAKLRKVNSSKHVVILEKTQATNQYFAQLQKFIVLEVGLVMIPVSNQKEAASILHQMVNVENRPVTNSFMVRPRPPPPDAAVLLAVKCIPKLGEVKAKALLENFGSIKGIQKASEQDLADVVGRASALQVTNFFMQSIS